MKDTLFIASYVGLFLIMLAVHLYDGYKEVVARRCPYKYGMEYWAVKKILGEYKVCPVMCDGIMYREDLGKDTIWVAMFSNRDGSNPMTVTSADANVMVFSDKKEAHENLGYIKLARKYAELEVTEL